MISFIGFLAATMDRHPCAAWRADGQPPDRSIAGFVPIVIGRQNSFSDNRLRAMRGCAQEASERGLHRLGSCVRRPSPPWCDGMMAGLTA
ncbi:MAG: hypothetical protein WCZ65_06020 [Lysobacteraceae bacterium]|jgi:hypothetical protein